MNFDLVVIGSGPAGYTGAIRAAQLGMRVACVEKSQTLGGTCLNVGCIPSKALLHFSKEYEFAKNHFSDIGIEIKDLKLNLDKMMQKKSKIVSDLCGGINGLFVKNKITKLVGSAKIIDKNTVEVAGDRIKTNNILIATGSEINRLNNVEIDGKNVISSDEALSLDFVPKKMIVIGGGYIGLELGSVWRRLGSDVTVVEYFDRIVPALDSELGGALFKLLAAQGMKFAFNSKVEGVKIDKNKTIVKISSVTDGKEELLDADVTLVSIGRKPNTKGLGIENVNIVADKVGRIEINEKYQTSVSNIYAVGDVVSGPMLAHKAEEEAIAAVEIMNGKFGHVNYGAIPSVIYTHPEVASVGITEDEAKKGNINYKIGKFPFIANSKARTALCTDGFVKIITDAKTDKVLGGHIIGVDAGNLIQEIVVLMEFSGSAEDLARTCHAHPTLSEAVREACLNVEKRAINF